jgi:hypothetical protein
MREEVIMLSQIDVQCVHEVSFQIGKHLTVCIETNDIDFYSDPSKITAEVTNLANWKLDKRFYDVYPRWRGLLNV